MEEERKMATGPAAGIPSGQAGQPVKTDKTEATERRYPTVCARLLAWFRAHPERIPVSSAELVTETGFVTREEIVRRVLRNVNWAEEIGDGYFVYRGNPLSVPPDRESDGAQAGEAPGQTGSDAEVPPPEREPLREEDRPLAARLKELLKQESRRNRLGVSPSYLKHLCGNPEDARLRRILKNAPWAAERYGLYRFSEAFREDETEEIRAVPAAGADRAVPADRTVSADRTAQAAREEEKPDAAGTVPAVCEQIALAVAPLLPSAPTEEADPPSPSAELPVRGNAQKPAPSPRAVNAGWEQVPLSVPEGGREEARIGTVLGAKSERRGRRALLRIDLGRELGVRRIAVGPPEQGEASEGVFLREPESLVGKQIVCVVRYDGGAVTRILPAYADTEQGAVPLSPAETVRNGERAVFREQD